MLATTTDLKPKAFGEERSRGLVSPMAIDRAWSASIDVESRRVLHASVGARTIEAHEVQVAFDHMAARHQPDPNCEQ